MHTRVAARVVAVCLLLLAGLGNTSALLCPSVSDAGGGSKEAGRLAVKTGVARDTGTAGGC